MDSEPGVIAVPISSKKGEAIRRALSSTQRVKLLELLAARAMNVNDIAAAVGISQPTASLYVRTLEDAGLVESELVTTSKGLEKRCWTKCDTLVLEIKPTVAPVHRHAKAETISLPIGMYTALSITPPCSMANETEHLPGTNDPQYFMLPARYSAQNLHFADGWLEYAVPCTVPLGCEVVRVEFRAEICSEAVGYDNECPSDITLWINGLDVGTWTSPGDFGGVRGRFNPDWWPDTWTQYGLLKTWSVDEHGSRIDNDESAAAVITDLGIKPGQTTTFRIGIKEDAKNKNGLNLFGRRFGNYPQDLVIHYYYHDAV